MVAGNDPLIAGADAIFAEHTGAGCFAGSQTSLLVLYALSQALGIGISTASEEAIQAYNVRLDGGSGGLV